MTLGKSIDGETLYCTYIQYKFDLSLVNPFIYLRRDEINRHVYLYLGIIYDVCCYEVSALGRFGQKRPDCDVA